MTVGGGYNRPLSLTNDQLGLMHNRMPGKLDHRDVKIDLESSNLRPAVPCMQSECFEVGPDSIIIFKWAFCNR